MPRTDTYEKLRSALGLSLSTSQALIYRREPQSVTERDLTTLAACLLAGNGGTLSALAEATGYSVASIRDQFSQLPERLAPVGLAAIQDGHEVRLVPLPWAADAVARMTTVEVQQLLTQEAIEVMIIIGMLGSPTRREIEARRGGDDDLDHDCASVLDRLCRRGLLEKSRDDSSRGDPNTYRLTAVALGAMGHATLDSFQAWCSQTVAI
jgi:chromosome segregation and condensation protein ScpB